MSMTMRACVQYDRVLTSQAWYSLTFWYTCSMPTKIALLLLNIRSSIQKRILCVLLQKNSQKTLFFLSSLLISDHQLLKYAM